MLRGSQLRLNGRFTSTADYIDGRIGNKGFLLELTRALAYATVRSYCDCA